MRLKYKLGLAIIVVSIGICLMTYQSYALWVVNLEGKENIVNSGCFKIEFEQINAPIMMNNTYPMSDSKGLTSTPYKFKITNKCSIASKYYVTLNTLTTNQLETFNLKDKIKFAIHKETENKPNSGINLGEYASDITHINEDTTTFSVENLDESIILATDVLNQGDEETYSIYLWYDENAGNEVMNKKFEGSINILSTATYKKEKTAVEYIRDIAKNDTTNLIVDDTNDQNLRYVGTSPNNYIDIGDNALWRVIGVMNNIDDGTGKQETRLKLIRSESIGEYSWNTSDANINTGLGINEWSQSKIKKLLNEQYYERLSTQECYIGENNTMISCSFDSNGLSEASKQYIGDVLWHIGSNGSEIVSDNILAKQFYELERSSNTGKICTSGDYCNDEIERETTWTGKVGLMYPSDYGYATSGGEITGRNICLETPLYNWKEQNDCQINNWLYDSNHNRWTMMVVANNTSALDVFCIDPTSSVDVGYAASARHIFPTVYLNSIVKITEGDGSIDNPFIVK